MLPKSKARITWLCIIVWGVIWLLDVSLFTKASGLNDWLANLLWDSNGKLNALLALVPGRLVHHEYWRMISYAFTHFGLLHVACNILLISFIGNILETRLSRADYILPILLGDILAGVACMLYVGNPDAHIYGSSPGIYALFGVFVANLYCRGLSSAAYMSKSIKYRFIIILIAANFLGIDTLILHAVGFAVGLLCGWMQAKRNHRFQLEEPV